MIFILILLILLILYLFKTKNQQREKFNNEIQVMKVQECYSDEECNGNYSGNICNKGICDCYSGSGWRCSKGPTLYKDPRLLEEYEKKDYSSDIKEDMTLQDYINWLIYNKDNLEQYIDKHYLELYYKSPSELTEEHLKKRKEKLKEKKDKSKYDYKNSQVNFILNDVMSKRSDLDNMAYNLNLSKYDLNKVKHNQFNLHNKLLPDDLDNLVNEYLENPVIIQEV